MILSVEHFLDRAERAYNAESRLLISTHLILKGTTIKTRYTLLSVCSMYVSKVDQLGLAPAIKRCRETLNVRVDVGDNSPALMISLRNTCW